MASSDQAAYGADLEAGPLVGDNQRQILLSEVSSDQVRHGFVKKVLGIVTCQLILTAAICLPFTLSPSFMEWAHDHYWIVYISLAVYLVAVLVLVCSRSAARKYPTNYLLLGMVTIALGTMLGFILSTYSAKSITIAVAATFTVTGGLTILAACSAVDFTGIAPYMFVICIVFSVFGLIIGLTTDAFDNTTHKIVAGIGALMFSVFFVADLQMILGGKHKYQFSLDDYVIAALSLYIDIVELFIYILQIVGRR